MQGEERPGVKQQVNSQPKSMQWLSINCLAEILRNDSHETINSLDARMKKLEVETKILEKDIACLRNYASALRAQL